MDSTLKSVLSVLKRVLPMKELPRIGWILEGSPRGESDSVAAHSYMVVLISLLLSKQLNKTFGPFDIEKVLTMATVHDLTESVTGDLDSGLKRKLAAKGVRGALEEIEQEYLSFLVEEIQDKEHLVDILREFDDGRTKEAKLVKFADVLDAFAYGRERLGKTFEVYLSECKERLKLHSPDSDGGLGIRLSEWIDLLISGWSSVPPKALE